MTAPLTTNARLVPRGLAAVIAELELVSPEIVTREGIAEALTAAGDPRADDPARVAAVVDGLRRHGWLLPLRPRGVWEFAPASRSGPFRSGDPFTEMRAALSVRPGLQAAIAMESAAFRRGLAEHPPVPDVLVIPKGLPPHSVLSLRSYRLVRLDLPEEATTQVRGLYMHTVAALVASMAWRPTEYGDWPNVRTWLPDAAARLAAANPGLPDGGLTGRGGLISLLKDAPHAAWARAAYLLRAGAQPAAAEAVLAAAPSRAPGPFYLGPRSRGAQYDHTTGVYDAMLVTG